MAWAVACASAAAPDQLELVRDALIQELAITAAISVASSFITFGAGAAVGLAGAAAICARYARPMRALIESWRTNRNIRAGVKFDQDLGRARRECERLEALGPAGKLAPRTTTAAGQSLTDAEKRLLEQGVSDSRGNSLTAALRRGDATPEQQRQADALTQAMQKLPTHEGPLIRHTNMRPETLDEIVPNQPYADKGFTSASTNPAGSNEFIAKNSNVEIRMVSKTGRDYSEYGTADEVLFPPNTKFFVHSKTPPDANGRVIITMSEI
ncbi:hypothetical protein [Nocardia sp. NPDC049149]|uniref:hypothetical protein n=1 Tax=Nocardia sp. NPDC049149 TaxID=3364315 RepID=UPI00371DCAB0